jgi:P27 family predicted phage terminase small subunit
MRGPRPKPTALKMLAGTASARAARCEPNPTSKAPLCPNWLPEGAKGLWTQLAVELEKAGCLKAVDGPAFSLLCLHLHLATLAAQALKDGPLAKDGRGRTVKHPAAQILRDNSLAAKSYLAEFGMTPAARTRIEVPEPLGQDDYDERYF